MENNELGNHKMDIKSFEEDIRRNENDPDEVDSLEEGQNNKDSNEVDDLIGTRLNKLDLISDSFDSRHNDIGGADSIEAVAAAASEAVDANISSCNTSTTSVSSDGTGNPPAERRNNNLDEMAQAHTSREATTSSSKSPSPNDDNDEIQELYDKFEQGKSLDKSSATASTTTIKRTHLLTLIFELYDLNEESSRHLDSTQDEPSKQTKVLIESYVEKLPPGKNLKNSILLAWKRKYFRLNSLGVLYVHDIVEEKGQDDSKKRYRYREQADEVYNIMGGRVEYEQNRRVISLDDGRGNFLVFRCCEEDESASEKLFYVWRECIDAQIVDRSHALWVRPNQPLALLDSLSNANTDRNVIIIDIGTCSIRAGLFDTEPKLPKLFAPTVCSRDFNGKVRVGFDAFDFLLGSSAPSTIDLRKSMSAWSLSSSHSNQLLFPFKTRIAIDKLGIDMESIEAIVAHVVENLNVACENYEVVVITTHKLSDKVNVQFLNMLLNEDKFKFKSATIINQTLMTLYSYNSNIGVIANLGEKIDIVPICNGLPFQNGVTNLAYGGSCMSEFLNSYISRGHVNYVNDMEQFYIRYIKEKSCYTAFNYQDELKKYPNDLTTYTMELKGRLNEFKKVEFPESARFKAVEGLFTPEIWGQDGQGIHKLIQKAIQSSSMDLRREMARSVFLCGGMSRIPGLKERLERELKLLFPPNLTVKVNCSDYSYHAAFLGAFRFIQQPEYEKLTIRRDEWATENVNCLRKWRSI